MKPQSNQDSDRSEPSRHSETRNPIGREVEILRVLDLSGSGFDKVMQLGVTHALLVNGGRPPDVVVGVSAGAQQAVALADVMRAGQLPENLEGTSARQSAVALPIPLQGLGEIWATRQRIIDQPAFRGTGSRPRHLALP